MIRSTINSTLSKCESHESFSNHPLVDKVVELIPYFVDHTLPLESEFNTTQVLLVTLDLTEQGGVSLVLLKLPLSNRGIAFDWNQLTETPLPCYMHLQIRLNTCHKKIYHTIIDEGAYVMIISSTTWKSLCSPQLVSITQNLLSFNRISSEPLGILPQLPITLEETIVHVDVMIVQGPLDFNFLLIRDYVYAMNVVMSTLF